MTNNVTVERKKYDDSLYVGIGQIRTHRDSRRQKQNKKYELKSSVTAAKRKVTERHLFIE